MSPSAHTRAEPPRSSPEQPILPHWKHAGSSYLVQRLLLLPVLLWAVSTLVFLAGALLPGDPVDFMTGGNATAEESLALRHRFELDLPLFYNPEADRAEHGPLSALTRTRYAHFMHQLLTGQLKSMHSERQVVDILAEKLPNTLQLAVLALVLAAGLGVPLGTLAARRPGGALDRLTLLCAIVLSCLPNFWLGPLLMMLFSVRLGWLPLTGNSQPGAVLLPALTLSLGLMAVLVRVTRTSVAGVLQEDHVRAARARGFSELRVLLRHALPSVAGPIVTLIGLQVGALLSGAILTEEIFGWPGVGRELVNAIRARDIPILQGCVALMAVSWTLVNLTTDVIQSWLDPRVRLD